MMMMMKMKMMPPMRDQGYGGTLVGTDGLVVEYHFPGAHTSCWNWYWEAKRRAAVAVAVAT